MEYSCVHLFPTNTFCKCTRSQKTETKRQLWTLFCYNLAQITSYKTEAQPPDKGLRTAQHVGVIRCIKYKRLFAAEANAPTGHYLLDSRFYESCLSRAAIVSKFFWRWNFLHRSFSAFARPPLRNLS
jgi:hypothetical protein